MSTNPQTLRDLGAFWVAQGGVNLGVVGNDIHCKGYHLGRDRIYSDCACRPKSICQPGQRDADYSVRTARDRAGLSSAASAIDLGRLGGSLDRLFAFSTWLVDRCRANAEGTRDIREVIWSPEGRTVMRWDRERGFASLPRPGEADNSHLTHTHISWYRDSERRDKRPVFEPYFLELPDTGTEDNMEIEAKHERWLLDGGPGRVTTVGAPVGPDGAVDYTRRLALTSGSGDTNRRYRLIARSRLSGYDGSLDDPLYRALASYALPVPDCTAAIAADRAKARVTWED